MLLLFANVMPESAFEVPAPAETFRADEPHTLPPVFENDTLLEFVNTNVWKALDPPCALTA